MTCTRLIRYATASYRALRPALGDDGTVAEVPLREFAAVMEVTASSLSSVRANLNGRRLSIGRPGRSLPAIAVTTTRTDKPYPLKLSLFVPEHLVTREAPPAPPVPVMRDREWFEQPAPIERLSAGDPQPLRESRVLTFVCADIIQAAVGEHTAVGEQPRQLADEVLVARRTGVDAAHGAGAGSLTGLAADELGHLGRAERPEPVSRRGAIRAASCSGGRT